MHVQRFDLVMFGAEEPPTHIEISVPQGSKLLKPLILSSGIQVAYLVPDLDTLGTEKDTFIIARKGVHVDLNDEFLDILSMFTEDTDAASGQPVEGAIIFTIFRQKK